MIKSSPRPISNWFFEREPRTLREANPHDEVALIVRDSRIDRLRVPVNVRSRWSLLGPIFCWVPILALWTAVWGRSTRKAIQVLLGAPMPLFTPSYIQQNLRWNAVVVVITVILIATYQGQSRLRWRTGRGTVRVAKTALVQNAVTCFGFLTASLIVLPFHAALGDPQPTDPNAYLDRLVHGVMAGPLEELVIVGLVVWALRSNNYRWWVTITVSALLRVPFHLYYGWGALGLTVWAIGSVLLYRRTGALLGLVIGHSFWNFASALIDRPGVAWAKLAVLVAGIVVVWIHIKSVLRAARNSPDIGSDTFKAEQ